MEILGAAAISDEAKDNAASSARASLATKIVRVFMVKLFQKSRVGAEIVARIPSLRDVAETIRTHHERWDGAGYPQGLAGEAIPLGGRILAVADAYHAIISGRPYQDARSSALALAEIDRCAGGQFDPAVVAALQRIAIPGRATAPC